MGRGTFTSQTKSHLTLSLFIESTNTTLCKLFTNLPGNEALTFKRVAWLQVAAAALKLHRVHQPTKSLQPQAQPALLTPAVHQPAWQPHPSQPLYCLTAAAPHVQQPQPLHPHFSLQLCTRPDPVLLRDVCHAQLGAPLDGSAGGALNLAQDLHTHQHTWLT
jgi:hypothetical protein